MSPQLNFYSKISFISHVLPSVSAEKKEGEETSDSGREQAEKCERTVFNP